MSLSKSDALAQLSQFINEHKLSQDDVMSLFCKEGNKYAVAHIIYLLGGLLLFTGVTFLVGNFFDEFNSVFQILLTLGLSVVLFISACWVQTKNVPLATALFIIPVLLEPFGFGVLIHHTLSDAFVQDNLQKISMAVFAFMSLQYIAAGLYLSKVKVLMPIGVLYFSALFITALFPLEEGYQFIEVLSLTGIFTVMVAQAYYFEKKYTGRSGWMNVPYVIGTIGVIISGGYFLTFGVEHMMAELCTLLIAFFMFYLGKRMNRSSVVWVAIISAVIAYCTTMVNLFDVTVLTGVILIISGLAALFSFKRFHKKAL